MKKNTIKILLCSVAIGFFVSSCNDFEDINKDPNAATSEQVMPEYFLNNALVNAQMNPDTAERAFVLYWKTAGRQQYTTGIAGGTYNDDWTTNYWNDLSSWLQSATLAITVGGEKKANGTATNYNDNVIQISRIWRAYLMSELTDNFGSAPIDAFKGVNPEFNSQKDVYYFMLAELKDAAAKIDPSITGMTDKTKNVDIAYGMDWNKWIKYANSMRMRLAMRLSEVDAAKAKSEFEDAAKDSKFIATSADNFAVAEKDGWDGLTGVMSRSWNAQIMSETLNNLMLGLGGVKSQDQLPSYLHASVKPDNYIGLSFPDSFPTKTNDPSVGYYLDGLPNKIDPRAYKNFYIPGDKQSAAFEPWFETSDDNMKRTMTYADGSTVTLDTKYTWSTYPIGDWGAALSRNGARGNASFTPAIAKQYRHSTNKRVFFGSWETYFLLAEAALRGWSVPMGDQVAYERGVKESFDYNNVGQFYASYISSTEYSRVGTSVSYSHTTEPGATHAMDYKDGKTGVAGTAQIKYPSNTIYKGGSVNNDKLTKIITQKFIANTPWLPLETWNDQRRLGLPFFENPAVENQLPNLPNLNSSNYMTNSVKNFPQRLPYPSGFRNNDPKGYGQAVSLLGGADAVLTPLWWAKKQ
ncbi:SusD/RagB family nutrient-binding outer membrane lipoprotein [Elizabethkingia anophelis]|uniref:SusD/RagB family nutrient-binding outer membrane lipoprotein n=1 Tax=Elizabethkingia anophelis TaxID=1117645 RepID=UPI00099556FD|nr:SusD/RagB family nutrient-binding outer membrane lipoprotein [Elizabethkingia anophelis]AQW97168.1 susd and RagB outer membrane lipoprotein domain protein [Elizabethkingia anophelis]ASV80307.1 SusD/RagB family nutrient-binding outer membrane lipoprotein [Elizabethkingia anophelis]MCL1648440.1 SusD/RagB family nutrient-binding outer membrane lipoprotein [Elizabethkingia anophelis]MCL1682715.1 SusD/RagB family nutrient-binding outer membrane lipoprotein [Elizabethkingia anophelis]MDV3551487.1